MWFFFLPESVIYSSEERNPQQYLIKILKNLSSDAKLNNPRYKNLKPAITMEVCFGLS